MGGFCVDFVGGGDGDGVGGGGGDGGWVGNNNEQFIWLFFTVSLIV